MENYIVSARKYRPGTFASVVGQTHVTNTLKSAILTHQLAHAFLFSGPRGVGKTTCARILAKAINCENITEEGEPCNHCDSCQAFNDGKSMTIHELDAASNNSVEDIRNLIEQTRYVPPPSKSGKPHKSVYIIDEVHMLTQSAFNAFLKTLEEPPAHVLFILATTEKHKILPTILSRCQKHDFRRIKVDDIAGHLEYISKEEKVDYEYAALQQIAMKADGALRDALSLYDQLVSYAGGKLTFGSVLENLNILDYDYYFRAMDSAKSEDHKSLLLLLDEVIDKGFEAKDFLVGLTEHLRNLLVSKDPETVKLLEASENVKARYLAQSKEWEGTFLLNAFHLCSESERQLRQTTHPRLLTELALLKLAHLGSALLVSQGDGSSGAEKKKPLAKSEPAGQPETTARPEPPAEAEAPEPVKEQLASEPEEKENPPANGAANSSVKPPKPVSGLARLQSLGHLKEALQAEKLQEKPIDDAEEGESSLDFEYDDRVSIDPARFQVAMSSYIERLKVTNKYVLATCLEQAQQLGCEPDHNRWIVKVSHTGQDLLLKDQELMPFMREALKEPSLFLEIQIEENFVNPNDTRPYTVEDRLREMGKRNPALLELQKKFKTRILY